MTDVLAQNNTPGMPDGALVAALGPRSIVLVGMMGAGKSSVGRKLGARLALPFIDADSEIEAAHRMKIPEIFDTYGEPYFRAGEAKVITRLLEAGPQVLATGGGAYMNAETRALVTEKGVSVWLKADFDVLMKRLKRRTDRPMLKTADPATTLQDLIALRYPVYAQADITIESRDVLHEIIVEEILHALSERLQPERSHQEHLQRQENPLPREKQP
jgi:shikimate kinase